MAKKASKEKKTKKSKITKPVKATKVAKASKPSKPVKSAKPTKSSTSKPAKLTDITKSLLSKPENKGSISKKTSAKVEMAKAGKIKPDKPARMIVEAVDNNKANENSKNLQVLIEKPVKLEAKTSKSSLLKVVQQSEEKPPEKSPEKKSEGKKKASKLEIDQNTKWSDLYEKFKAIKPVVYNMREIFEANQPVQHKVLGWGWILSNENDRLEVLFKDGKKILISNYKG